MTRKHTITLTATATTASANTTSYIKGCILSVQYVKGSTPFSSTADLTITTFSSSDTILGSLAIGASNFTKAPRLTVVNTTNGAISNESGLIPVSDERIKATISKTTATGQSGTFYVYELL